MRAPQRLVEWLARASFIDRHGRLPPGTTLQYHSRSDEHSKQLGQLIVEDLLDACPTLREQASRGAVAYRINLRHRWPNGKVKTLDLAIGIASHPLPPIDGRSRRLPSGRSGESLSRLLIACEEKAVMTEHGKSQPRIYSELNDAHTIVHQGDPATIAAGITMLNIAESFVSPLRQRPDLPLVITPHHQPEVAARMVEHLRHLPRRQAPDGVGLDAYCTFVVNLDNQGHVSLHEAPPAPQRGDADHYETFLHSLAGAYTARFADLADVEAPPPSVEESLRALARQYPGLLTRAGDLIAADAHLGADLLRRLLTSLESPEASDSPRVVRR